MKDTRTNEELNRIIAEWMGWRFVPSYDCPVPMLKAIPDSWFSPDEERHWTDTPYPNYCTDLNAIHEAENLIHVFPKDETLRESVVRKAYRIALEAVCMRNGWGGANPVFRATARQRAEALVTVIEQSKS